MTDDDIEKALSADGQCAPCGGSGRRNEVGHGGARLPPCLACGGTGRDPHAFLRVAQAVGWLLLRRERREAAETEPVPTRPKPSHGMTCDGCRGPATVGCKGCDIASCDDCEENRGHGGDPSRHPLVEITELWTRGPKATMR